MMDGNRKPFSGSHRPGNGCVSFGQVALGLVIWSMAGTAMASDGATEALELRLHAEWAIAEEATNGNPKLAGAMRELLPGLLVEHLVARDETITLDTVDVAFVQEQFDVAALMEEPGVAMALAVFSGPGTGYEHGIRTSLANLADFHLRKAGELSDKSKALNAHERVMQHHWDKLNALDVTDDVLDKADKIADKAAEEAAKVAAKAATKEAEAAAKLDVEADKQATKDAEQAEKDAAKDGKDGSGSDGGSGGGPPEGKGKKK